MDAGRTGKEDWRRTLRRREMGKRKKPTASCAPRLKFSSVRWMRYWGGGNKKRCRSSRVGMFFCAQANVISGVVVYNTYSY